ncbi:MAG: DUF4139 domain-containing protein [Candidatus Hodarchaeota archaeon]
MTTLTTNITRVTVYPQKALVAREGTIQIKPDKTALEVTDLPIYLDPHSVRVKGLSHTETIIEGIDVQRISHHQASKPKQDMLDTLETLNNQKEQLTKELEFLQTRKENNDQFEIKFLDQFARYYSMGKVTLEQFNALRNQLSQEYQEHVTRGRELKAELKKIDREIEIIEEQIEKSGISHKPDNFTLTVYLNNPSPNQEDNFQLEINYMISRANWHPMYDFRANKAKGEVIVDYFGMVSQTTGEDWNDVELILSTAKPSVVTSIPEITPWYLNVAPPDTGVDYDVDDIRNFRRKMSASEVRATTKALPKKEADKGATMLDLLKTEAARVSTAAVEDTGETQAYTIPKKETIPSEGKPHQVLVAQTVNSLKDDFLAIPSVMADIIHRGKMTNESNLIFLPGQVRLFEGNEFIGKTQIGQIAPTEKFTFVLGTTGKIKISRKLSSQEVSKKGMISKSRQRRLEVTIEITNNRTTNTPLVLKDRLPSSLHEDIKVKILDLKPPPTEQSKLNICTWNFELKPQEKQKIVETYEIENPVDVSVVGV